MSSHPYYAIQLHEHSEQNKARKQNVEEIKKTMQLKFPSEQKPYFIFGVGRLLHLSSDEAVSMRIAH